jgi:hypothetical protein
MFRRFIKRRDYDKIVVKIQEVGETTSYTASYEDLEFEGYTVGDEIDIKDVLSRMLKADKDIPDSLTSLVSLVVGYVESMVNSGVRHVTTSYSYEFAWDCEVGVNVNALYDIGGGSKVSDRAGWVVKVSTYFDGYDGLTVKASHDIKKKLQFGDTIDVDVLRAELTWLVKIAYNAYKGTRYHKSCL